MTPTRLIRIAQQRFRVVARPRDLESDIERELALHLDLLVQEKRREGLPEEAALREARREFGDVDKLTQCSRDTTGLTWLADLRQDARHGVRMLRRSPGFTTIASMALALGIGATAAVTGASGLILARPLPFADADRIVTIQTLTPDGTWQRGGVSARDYFKWSASSATLETIGAATSGPRTIGPDPGGAPADRVPGQAFTPSLFAALGARPQAGRLFGRIDDPFNSDARVVVISHRLWQRRYGGASDTIGRTMIVDGAPRRIVAVMRSDFRFPNDATELWTPLIFAKDPAARTADRIMAVTGRLRRGVTLAQAQAELGSAVRIVPLRESLYGWTKPRLVTFGVAVALVLMLACFNVAGLLLARGAMRRREVALRIALGATRARIVRQLVTESLVLGLGAGLLGVAVAWPAMRAVRAALAPPPGAPGVGAIAMDGWILVAVVLLAAGSSLICGLLPALAEVRVLRDGRGFRFALVSAQIALAEVLLIGAALLAISFVRVSGRVMNMDARGLLTFEYGIRAGEFVRPLGRAEGVSSFDVSPTGSQTVDRAYQALRAAIPDGTVGGISYPPVNSLILPTVAVHAEGTRSNASADAVAAHFVITPDLFAALRTPILRGREFDARDTADHPWTVVINETMARLCWSGEDPIGRQLRLDIGPEEQVREVIGVVADIPPRRQWPAPQAIVYTSHLQHPRLYRGRAPGMFGEMTFVVRSSRGRTPLLASASEALANATPERPLVNVGTLEAHFWALMTEQRNYVAALGAFALSALFLAVIGLHGAVAYEIHGRTTELAIRKALGARTQNLLFTMGRPASVVAAVGLVCGLAVALALTPLLAPQLWAITASDPMTLASMSIVVVAAALAACITPMRRGLAVDPAVRLRAH